MLTDRQSEDTFYNYTDLNRVENKTCEVAALLTGYGYPVMITTKTNWSVTDFPTEFQMSRYLGNVKKCATQFNAVPGVTLPIFMNDLDYIGANNIEKTLIGIEELVDAMIAAFRECGTFNCGEG